MLPKSSGYKTVTFHLLPRMLQNNSPFYYLILKCPSVIDRFSLSHSFDKNPKSQEIGRKESELSSFASSLPFFLRSVCFTSSFCVGEVKLTFKARQPVWSNTIDLCGQRSPRCQGHSL